MRDAVVFIPTRQRGHCLAKALPFWQRQGDCHIFLVVEKWEYGKHLRLISNLKNRDWNNPVKVLRLPRSHQGINYARNWIVKTGEVFGVRKIIMSDDDVYPHPLYSVHDLFDFDTLPTLGLGVMLSFYGLLFGNKTIANRTDPLLCQGAMGKRLFSLDIERTIKAGNFDIRFNSGYGDNELIRQSVVKQAYNWYVHAGVRGVSIAGRFTQGGLNGLHDEDQAARLFAQHKCHILSHKKWPKYINDPGDEPGKRLVCKWTKLYDDYIPNWRDRITWKKK